MRGGDLFVYNQTTGKTRQITRTTDAEGNPRFLPDGKRISFTRGDNLYVMSLDGGSLVQMTDIRPPGAPAVAGAGGGGRGAAGGAARPTRGRRGRRAAQGHASQEYLKKEQKDLLEIVRERAARREEEEARRKKENPRKPFTLQARQTSPASSSRPTRST